MNRLKFCLVEILMTATKRSSVNFKEWSSTRYSDTTVIIFLELFLLE